jgi:hypothetical protein
MPKQLFEVWSSVMISTRSRWRWLGYGLAGLAFVYLIALIIVSREQIQGIHWEVYRIPILAAMLIYPASFFVQYLVWSRIVSFYHRTGWQDMAIYFRVLLTRRLPGGIWHWVDRTTMYTGATDLPGRVVLRANFLEWALLLLIAGAIAAAGWPGNAIWLKIISGALLILALYLAFSWQPASRSKPTRFLEAFSWLTLFTIAWIAGGIIIYLFSRATQIGIEVSSQYQQITLIHCIWAWAISGGSGLLMVFLPAGMGIREITLTWLLASYLPVSAILLVAILIRVTYALADMVWGSIGMFFSLRVLRVEDREVQAKKQ